MSSSVMSIPQEVPGQSSPAFGGFSTAPSGSGPARNEMPTAPLGIGDARLLPLVQASVSQTTWAAYGPRRPVVWLIGHSYIYWAAQRAAHRPGGRTLGFRDLEVHWKGVKGLRWAEVLSQAIEVGRTVSSPVVLVIHAGGNDLCVLRLNELLIIIRSDLERLPGFFNEVVLVWSEIVSRVKWQGARDAAAMERARRTVNARTSRFVRSKGGVVVRHRQLEGDNRRLMISDGTHLNDIGLDIFLSGLQDGVEQALYILGGGRSSV
ncbi:uncharacterized protein [Dendropsophus ebraccatus]|uniref:uncharacterized protein n=1 Tax=Dendropsophus ebraccatus TaxID=150705 RepID=UPI0038313F65